MLGEADKGKIAVVSGFRVFADVYQTVMGSFRTARIEDHRPPKGFDAPRQPVINVNWYEALAFANLNGVRLPTEAKWEFAARVRLDGGLRIYATPNDNVEESHYWRDGKTTSTIDVDDSNYPSLPNGLRHMSGNVWEWALDWFGPYSEGSANNPAGPLSGQRKVLRGGSWNSDPQVLRAAFRNDGYPVIRLNFIGFRCASSPRPT